MKKNIVLAFVFTLMTIMPTIPYAQAAEYEETEYVSETDYSSSGSSSYGSSGVAVGNFAIKGGPMGNIYVVDSRTELEPGIGGYIAFEYRFHPHFSAEVGVSGVIQDGKGISSGDNNILLFGLPTFDIKFYFLGESRWDPYALLGFGLYYLTEGSAKNGTDAFGIGANLGLGLDYYITQRFSVGLAATFRSIAFIESFSGDHTGSSLFPFSMSGNFAYHF